MRTSVHPNPPNSDDPDDTDEFPDCAGSVSNNGALVVADESSTIETTYHRGEWVAFTTTAEN